MSRNSHFNANARRSGGDRLGRIHIGGERNQALPTLAIQCFEGRHSECTGKDVFFGAKCECECHAHSATPKP